MRRIMKQLVLLLVLVMTTSMFSGCGIIKVLLSERELLPQQNEAEVVEKKEEQEIPESDLDEKVYTNDNLIANMSNAEKREINIFLSNFSEAGYMEASDMSDAEHKVHFAFLHNMINNDDAIIYDGERMGISADLADKTLVRFFGETVPRATPGDGSVWVYENGKFLKPAASGDNYPFFSIAVDMRDNYDGTYTVEFKSFADKDYFEWPKSEWYTYTLEYAERTCDPRYSGVAVVKKKTVNGSQTYELIDYTIVI